MYIVRFLRSDGQENEEYFYYKEEDALFHFSLFEEDDSRLYSCIEFMHIYKDKEVHIAKMNL